MTDHQRAPIVFGLAEQPKGPNALDEAREEHRKRAERFGVQYVEPARARADLRLEARRERVARSGFVTGIDLFSAEEEEKRRRRAAKFGLSAEPTAEGEGNGNGNPWGGPSAGLSAAAGAVIELDPDDDPAELERRRARAERFGVPLAPPKPPQRRVGAHDGLMDVDALEAPADPSAGAAPRPEGVYLYGVDLMSTGDCLRYFTEYGPTFVEWINDSACVVLFADGQSAARAMRGTGVALPPAAAPAAGGGGGVAEGEEGAPPMPPPPQQQEDAMDDGVEAGAEEGAAAGAGAGTDAAAAAAAVCWFRGRDFVKGGTAVRLLYRGATEADRRDLTAPKPPSRHLWKTVAQVGSKCGRRGGGPPDEGGGGGGGGRSRGGGGGGYPQEEHQGRRRRRMDGSCEEVDMADGDGDDGDGGGDGDDDERWARGRGRGRGGGGGEQHQRDGPRRVVRARRRGGGGRGEQEEPEQQQRQQGQQKHEGEEQQQERGGPPRRGGRGRRMAHRARVAAASFLEVN